MQTAKTAKSSGLHNKYRPLSLSRVIGSESAVGILSGIVESQDYPSAVLLFGPSSSGKTTLARAFASDILGEDCESSPNMTEVNFSDNRSIEDVRSLISVAGHRPMRGKRRFIYCDEAHGVLSNSPAANALLKPLEEPIPTTTWILSSMEPDKFAGTETGRAIRGRCVPITLKAPTTEDLYAQARRIAIGEKVSKIIGKERLLEMVNNSDKTYRGVAAQIEVFCSLKSDPEAAFKAACDLGVSYNQTPEESLIASFVSLLLTGKPEKAIQTLFKIKDGVGLIMKLGYYSWFLLGCSTNGGKPPPGIWGNKEMWSTWNSLKGSVEAKDLLRFHSEVVGLRLQSGAFSVSGQQAAAMLVHKFNT